MSNPVKNPLWVQYEAFCTFPDCAGHLKLENAESAGLQVGSILPHYSAEPSFGRCPLCKRYQMKVTKGPPPREVRLPQGFTKIPTE